ncbi:hypothetical protein BJX96DRAFT_129521 [Aspergillus floccosus]
MKPTALSDQVLDIITRHPHPLTGQGISAQCISLGCVISTPVSWTDVPPSIWVSTQ